eukprot:GHVP01067930.1.p1 GENE.GHVP01067930.1~~GHVP01067930.1.p1  ORF type:complete len:194 (+),score=22.63 GHVP01067930.1:245-826(+)
MSNLFIQPVGPSDDVEERRNFSAEELNFCMLQPKDPEVMDSSSDTASSTELGKTEEWHVPEHTMTTMPNGKEVLWLPLKGNLESAFLFLFQMKKPCEGKLSYKFCYQTHSYTFSWCRCENPMPLCKEATCGNREHKYPARDYLGKTKPFSDRIPDARLTKVLEFFTELETALDNSNKRPPEELKKLREKYGWD